MYLYYQKESRLFPKCIKNIYELHLPNELIFSSIYTGRNIDASQSGKLAEYRDLEDRVFPRCCCCKWEEINAGTNAREPEPNLLHIVLVLDVHIWR